MSDAMDAMISAREGEVPSSETPVEQDQVRTMNDGLQKIRPARRIFNDDGTPNLPPPAPVREEPAKVETPAPAPVPDEEETLVPVPPPPAKDVIVTEEWQATDEDGNKIGTPSKVIGKGKTEAEAYKDLAKNLKNINIEAAKKIKKLRDAAKGLDYANATLSFEPRPVSPEDRVRIAALLASPETLIEGQAELYKLQYGETPQEASARRKREMDRQKAIDGSIATDQFLKTHPDFPKSPAAQQIMTDAWVEKNSAAPEGKEVTWSARNLEIIYDELVESGILTPLQLSVKNLVNEQVSESQVQDNTEYQRDSQEKPPQVATPAPDKPAANTDGSTGNLRPRGTRFSTLSTEHGQSPSALPRQAEAEAFRKQVFDMPMDELKRRIRNDKVFAARLNALPKV